MIGAAMTTRKIAKQATPGDPAAKLERQRERAERRLVRQREASEKAWGKYQIELREVAGRASEKQFQQDGIDWLEGRDTDGARRIAAIIEQKKKAVAASRIVTPITPVKPSRMVRKAEASEFDRKRASVRDAVVDVGTGQTILKLRQKAIPKLIDQGKLGQEEMQAAAEILIAFNAIASRLMCRGINYDRVDNGGGGSGLDWPAKIARPVANYQAFARAWTRRNEDYGDPTLEIVIDAVIDEMHLSAIPRKRGYGEARIERALIGGLRDYAARAGFVTGHKAIQWQAEAAAVFGPAEPELSRAVRRAAVER